MCVMGLMNEKYIFLKVCLLRNFLILYIIPINFDFFKCILYVLPNLVYCQ